MKDYVGVYQEFNPMQVGLLRAQYIFDVSSDEYKEDMATALFDLGLIGGWHPDGLDQTDLRDELDWMEVTAVENSVEGG